MQTEAPQPPPRTIARQLGVLVFWVAAACYFLFRMYSGTISAVHAAIGLTLCAVMLIAQAAVMVVMLRKRHM